MLRYVVCLPGSYAPTDPSSSAQWNFVAEKLQEVDRRRTPWVAVMFHTPWWGWVVVMGGDGLVVLKGNCWAF